MSAIDINTQLQKLYQELKDVKESMKSSNTNIISLQMQISGYETVIKELDRLEVLSTLKHPFERFEESAHMRRLNATAHKRLAGEMEQKTTLLLEEARLMTQLSFWYENKRKLGNNN